MNKQQIDDIAAKIYAGQIGVLPTDTIYGIAASALDKKAVERVYRAKRRERHKKLIILIADINQLPMIGVNLTEAQKKSVKTLWPGPYSLELKCAVERFKYLHNGTNKIAVRLPDLKFLQEIMKQTGPMTATSANLSGRSTPDNIEEIKLQLPDLDFYVEGPVKKEPSKLVRVDKEGSIEWLERK